MDCTIRGLVNGVPANILVDTGAATTVLSKNMWERCGARLQGISDRRLVGTQGTPLHLYGSTYIKLELPPEKFQVNVIVADTPIADVILGRDFLRSQRCAIEMKDSSDVLHVQSRGQSIAIAQNKTVDSACGFNVILQESVVVPPCSEIEVVGCTSDLAKQKTWILQGKESKRCAVMVGRALVEPEGNQIPVRLLNPRDVEVPVSKGTTLAELESIPDGHTISALSQEFEIEPSPEHRRKLWEMVEGAEQSLNHEEKAQLFALLLEYHTLLAIGDDDLGRTA